MIGWSEGQQLSQGEISQVIEREVVPKIDELEAGTLPTYDTQPLIV